MTDTKNPITPAFSDLLREARETAGLSREEVAALTQVPVATQAQWENGHRLPPAYMQRVMLNTLRAQPAKPQ